jgi:hypothetical protein
MVMVKALQARISLFKVRVKVKGRINLGYSSEITLTAYSSTIIVGRM